MTRTLPPHGTRACWLNGCRRPECTVANRRYNKRYQLDRARNGPRRVPSGPAVARVRELAAAGWSTRQIAAAAGCSESEIAHLFHGRYATTAREVAHRILTAAPSAATSPAKSWVDSTGSARRIRALIAIGHPVVNICRAAEISRDAVARVMRGRPTITAEHAEALRVLYARWSGIPGSNVRARNRARRAGWPGPLAWDEHTIDDPQAVPDAATVPDLPAHRLAASLADEVQHLARYGVPAEEIAARVDRSVSYVRAQLAGQRGPGWRQRETAGEVA